ncbi:MAG TPA: hypothetical protein VF938_03510 [Candidatus Angelobacter sp.]
MESTYRHIRSPGRIRRRPKSESQSEILREALRLLKEREELKGLRLAGLRKQIALGAREADRGKFVDGARTFADIQRKSKQRKTSGAMKASLICK